MLTAKRLRVPVVLVGAALLGACVLPPRGEPPVLERSIRLTPDPIVFASPGVDVDVTVPVTVTNDGQVVLRGLEFSTIDPTANVLALSVVSDTCPGTLAPGASCTLTVRVDGMVSADDDSGRVGVTADPDPGFPAPGYSAVFEIDLILI